MTEDVDVEAVSSRIPRRTFLKGAGLGAAVLLLRKVNNVKLAETDKGKELDKFDEAMGKLLTNILDAQVGEKTYKGDEAVSFIQETTTNATKMLPDLLRTSNLESFGVFNNLSSVENKDFSITKIDRGTNPRSLYEEIYGKPQQSGEGNKISQTDQFSFEKNHREYKVSFANCPENSLYKHLVELGYQPKNETGYGDEAPGAEVNTLNFTIDGETLARILEQLPQEPLLASDFFTPDSRMWMQTRSSQVAPSEAEERLYRKSVGSLVDDSNFKPGESTLYFDDPTHLVSDSPLGISLKFGYLLENGSVGKFTKLTAVNTSSSISMFVDNNSELLMITDFKAEAALSETVGGGPCVLGAMVNVFAKEQASQNNIVVKLPPAAAYDGGEPVNYIPVVKGIGSKTLLLTSLGIAGYRFAQIPSHGSQILT